MSVNNKRVFYVKYLAHDIYTEIMKGRPDVRLDRLENESPEEVAAPILAAAHAYQVGAARDEPLRDVAFFAGFLADFFAVFAAPLARFDLAYATS